MSIHPSDLEFMEKIRQGRLRKAGLRGIYVTASCEEGLDAYRRFSRGRGTYFWGLPGRGKTYAAACCVRLAIEDGINAKLTTSKALLDAVKDDYDGADSDALGWAERYELLVLDDLGVERSTDWAMETLTGLVDARVSAGLPTIFTSNYSLGDLRDRWGGMNGMRLASRIAGSCERVELTGNDRRWQ